MKNFKNPFFAAVLLAAFTTLLIWSCGKTEDLTKDVNFFVDGDLIKVPLAIQFVDANEANLAQNEAQDNDNSYFPDFEIKVTGRDAGKVYSMVLSKEFRVEKGIIEFAAKKTDMPTIDGSKTLEFTVEATSKSNKYLKVVKSFILTDTSTAVEVIPVINLNAPPKGVSVTKATIDTDANGAIATQINTNNSASAEKVEVNVPAGTKFYTADGKELIGKVEVQLVHFNNRDSATSLAAFPGGFGFDHAIDINGKQTEPGRFSTYGFIALDMNVGGTPVKNFSGTGLEVTMGINPDSPNPDETGKIQAGDKIPVWSIDVNDIEKGWKEEVVGTVTGSGNDLKVTFNQKHLSFWNLDIFWNSCPTTSIKFPATGVIPGYYYMEAITVNTGSVLTQWSDNISNNCIKTLRHIPRNTLYYLKIYKIVGCSRQLIYRSQHFGGCAPVTLTLQRMPSASSIITVAGQVSGHCASRPSIILRPTSTVYYRPSGTTCWTMLGVVSNGYFALSGVLPPSAQSFDFKVVVGGFATQYFYNKTPDPALLNSAYNLNNILIPAQYCKMIGF
jgi:hypothetical protein